MQELGQIAKLKANGCQSGLLTEKGLLMTWGCGDNGRLGHGDPKSRSSPTPVQNLRTGKTKSDEMKVGPSPCGHSATDLAWGGRQVVDFAIGQYHMIVLTETLDIFAFGRNHLGQLGLGEAPQLPSVLMSMPCRV